MIIYISLDKSDFFLIKLFILGYHLFYKKSTSTYIGKWHMKTNVCVGKAGKKTLSHVFA